jgi:hypothetical protein
MKIQIVSNVMYDGVVLLSGDSHDIPEKTALDFIQRKNAIAVEEERNPEEKMPNDLPNLNDLPPLPPTPVEATNKDALAAQIAERVLCRR